MQKALIHENIIQVLSRPHSLSRSLEIQLDGGRSVTVKGFGSAHFAALQYVNRLVNDASFLQPKDAEDAKSTSATVARCVHQRVTVP